MKKKVALPGVPAQAPGWSVQVEYWARDSRPGRGARKESFDFWDRAKAVAKLVELVSVHNGPLSVHLVQHMRNYP